MVDAVRPFKNKEQKKKTTRRKKRKSNQKFIEKSFRIESKENKVIHEAPLPGKWQPVLDEQARDEPATENLIEQQAVLDKQDQLCSNEESSICSVVHQYGMVNENKFEEHCKNVNTNNKGILANSCCDINDIDANKDSNAQNDTNGSSETMDVKSDSGKTRLGIGGSLNFEIIATQGEEFESEKDRQQSLDVQNVTDKQNTASCETIDFYYQRKDNEDVVEGWKEYWRYYGYSLVWESWQARYPNFFRNHIENQQIQQKEVLNRSQSDADVTFQTKRGSCSAVSLSALLDSDIESKESDCASTLCPSFISVEDERATLLHDSNEKSLLGLEENVERQKTKYCTEVRKSNEGLSLEELTLSTEFETASDEDHDESEDLADLPGLKDQNINEKEQKICKSVNVLETMNSTLGDCGTMAKGNAGEKEDHENIKKHEDSEKMCCATPLPSRTSDLTT